MKTQTKSGRVPPGKPPKTGLAFEDDDRVIEVANMLSKMNTREAKGVIRYLKKSIKVYR